MLPMVSLTIDLNALRHNLAEVARFAPHSRILAMVKADAYGHGLLAAAQALSSADGFGVARIEEALTLRDKGFQQKIVLLNPWPDKSIFECCAANSIDIVMINEAAVDLFCASTLSSPVNLWLKVDTGMHRLGLAPDKLPQYFQKLQSHASVRTITLMSHFSDSEIADQNITRQQLDTFNLCCDGLIAPRSLANSAAIIQSPHTHADWVRPGIMLYGADPLMQSSANLKPVMNLHSRVLSLRHINSGESVGYNQSWTATRPSIIATIAIGYGDGYPRHAKNGTPVLINGERFPLAGRVSMDLITVDVTDAKHIQCGDEVTLWGLDSAGNALNANEIAEWADTVSYHLFTGITARVARSVMNA